MALTRSIEEARCFKHPGAHVVSVGTYETKPGTRRRYRCTPVVGKAHKFSVGLNGDSTPVAQAIWTPPPPCPEHPGSKLVRNGTYGTSTRKPRQRYRCSPADGSKPHAFTPTLPRAHVHQGSEHCDLCDEIRGVHHGEPAVAWAIHLGIEVLPAPDKTDDLTRWTESTERTCCLSLRRSARSVGRLLSFVGSTIGEEGKDRRAY